MDEAALHLFIDASLRESARTKRRFLESCRTELAAACRLVIEALATGHKLLLFGNGGSAADAQHIAAEMVCRYKMERRPLPAIALTVDTSALTAIGNDYGYDQVFSRQVEALGQKGDVALAISTSGTSPSVVKALEVAKKKGIKVIGLTGKKGEAFAKACDVALVVPTFVVARIQECHIAAGHVMCEATDLALFADDKRTKAGKRHTTSPKELDLETLLALRQDWRDAKHTVVWTNGMFDVLHVGHIESLTAARALGDVLVVGVNADETVKKAKGEDRPIFPLAERIQMLTALEVVDYVVAFEEATPEAVLSKVQPDIHCKGADYAPPNGAPIPEKKIVEGYGGRIEFLPLVPNRSTTSTVARLLGR
jgi:phosphoheptose isomerase